MEIEMEGRKQSVIYFAGGCFWGTQHYISKFEGVLETEVGYANGNVAEPTYQQVYTDLTGHVECVKVTYDKEVIPLKTLCRFFFRSIDPLIINRQGDDHGTRYRTGIYWTDASDEPVVNEAFEEVQQQYDQPLAVEKSQLRCFYSGEEYHQQYLIKNPDGYCHLSPSLIKSAMAYSRIIADLKKCSDEEKKVILQKFFQTGSGDYGEGDTFFGVTAPQPRNVVRKNKDISYEVLEWLLENDIFALLLY